MVEKPIWFGQNHRILVDPENNIWKLQFYNSEAKVWYDIISYLPTKQAINMNPLILKDSPTLRLRGTEADEIETQLKEDAGDTIIYDESNAVTLLRLLANTPLEFDIPVPIIFETPITDLAADSVTNKYISLPIIPPLAQYVRSASIEATWTATHGDSITEIEIHDVTRNGDVCKVDGNEGTDIKSSYGTIYSGNTLDVRINITTKSGTAGAKTSVQKALVYFRASIV